MKISEKLDSGFYAILSSDIGLDELPDSDLYELSQLVYEYRESLLIYTNVRFGDLLVNPKFENIGVNSTVMACIIRYKESWGRIFQALKIEYNPASNYNEHEVIEHSGNDANAGTTSYSGTNSQTNATTGTIKDTESGTITNNGNENVTKNETISSATSYDSTYQNPTGKTDNSSSSNTSLTQNRDLENNETISNNLKIDGSNSGSSSTNSNLTYGHKITRDLEGIKPDEFLSKNLAYEIEFREYYSIFDIIVQNCVDLISSGIWSDD